MPCGQATGFVADGWERVLRASGPRIRWEVEQAFTAQLAEAGFWQRVRLRWAIEREIRRRVLEAAPPCALY